MNPNEETRDQIIAAAREAGFHVTRLQLRRWRKFGLLERSRRRGRGRGAGSASFYPAGTTLRALKICALIPKHRSLSEIAWELWMDGEQIPARVALACLRALAQTHDEVLARIRPLGFERPEGSREALAFARKAAESSAVPRKVRSNLADENSLQTDRLQTVIRTAAQIMLGTYDADAAAVLADEDSDGAMLIQAAGFGPARTDRVLDLAPWLPQDPSAGLEDTARLVGGDWLPLIDQLTIEELCRARDRWKSFKELAISFGDALGGMVGANIAGFPSMAEMLRTEDVDQTAMAVLMFVLAERSSNQTFLDGFKAYEGVAASWFSRGLPASRAIEVLRDEVPALSEALSPERLQSVIGSKADFDANLEALRPLTEEHQAEVEAALRRAGIDLSAFASSTTPSSGE